jgi:hypothetical protein
MGARLLFSLLLLSSLHSLPSSGGLDEKCTEEMLHAAFIPFGDIVEVNIPKDFKESEWGSGGREGRMPGGGGREGGI